MKTLIRAKETGDGIFLKTREDGKTNIEHIDFENYFYVNKLQFDNCTHQKKKDKIHSLALLKAHGNYWKVILHNNEKRNEVRYLFESIDVKHYEADIMTPKRWLLDTKTPINAEQLTWVKYDIETKDDGSFDKDIKGTIIAREPILSVSYYDQDGNKHFIKNENKDNPVDGEKDLLKKHNAIIEQFDCILAWNGYRFDDAYCKQRNEYHGFSNIHYDLLNQLDYMELVKKNYGGLSSYSLNNVAKVVLKDVKIELEGTKGKGAIYQSWLKSFDGDTTLEDYNMKDVELMYEMEKKLNFIGLHKKEANLANCFIQETMHNSDICDFILLNKFKDKGLISPSKPSMKEVDERKKNSILGAYTFCLKPGVHDDVFVFDFKSFYPTTMTANNICITTKLYHDQLEIHENYVTIPENQLERNKEMVTADTKYFRNDKRGIIADVCDWLIDERDKIKYKKFDFIESDPDKYIEMKLDENAIKTVANSLYGAMSFIYFRYYDFDVASSITQFCRGIIQECIRHAERLGFNVIQGDTDSIMFTQGDANGDYKDLEYEFYKIFDEIAEERNMNSKTFKLKNPKTGEFEEKPHYIVFEHEKTFHKMISVKKKNYADLMEIMDGDGNPTGKVEIGITGLECKKKDTNPLAKKLQYNLIEYILKDEFSETEWKYRINKYKDQLLNNRLPTDYLVMKKSISKNPDEYGGFMMDSKTGKPKLKIDGTPRIVPIPAHVKLAKRLIEEGNDIYVGDQISYIVQEIGPIVAISLEEYMKGSDFDREYYWDRITKPLLKILFVTHPDFVIKNWELWTIKELDEKKKDRFIAKLQKEVDKIE